MRLTFEIAGDQIDGARDYQEDAFLSSYLDNSNDDGKSSALVIMADGMGGHAAGNIASDLVVSTFNKSFTPGFTDDIDVTNALRASLAKANGALSESIRDAPALDGMGCTMVAGVFLTGKCWWISVGDSHLYLVRDRELNKKNEDHSYGGYLDRMSSQGMDVEPEPGFSRNMLMSAMTGDDIAEIDCPATPVQLRAGDRLIVASDGLDTLSEGTIIQMCAWSNSAKECADALLKAVEDAAKPRQDNTTVVVVDVHDRDKGAVPPMAQAPGDAAATVLDNGLGDTQPIKLTDIEIALDDAAVAPGMRAADFDEDDDEGVSVVRVIVVIGLLIAVLGGIGAYWYFFMRGGDPVAPVNGGSKIVQPSALTVTPVPVNGTAELTDEQQIVNGSVDTTTLQPARVAPMPSASPVTPAAAPSKPTGPPQLRDILSDGSQGPAMVVVSLGNFKMGSKLFDKPDESPQHQVSLNGLAVSKYEISQSEYTIFATATKRRVPWWRSDLYPGRERKLG